ncbi:MAG: hypothetical protein ACFFG0_00095 [Candidatus Thorarchaeota archaeon]
MSTIIVPDLLLDVPAFQESWPDFKAVDDYDRDKIEVDMEVRLRRAGEYFKVKITGINGENLVGIVLTEQFYFTHPFKTGDYIKFQKKNVIDIYDINRQGVLY